MLVSRYLSNVINPRRVLGGAITRIRPQNFISSNAPQIRSSAIDHSRQGLERPRAVDKRRPAIGRRFRYLVGSNAAELGGELSEAERSLVRQAVALQLQAERMQEAIVKGGWVTGSAAIPTIRTSKPWRTSFPMPISMPVSRSLMKRRGAASACRTIWCFRPCGLRTHLEAELSDQFGAEIAAIVAEAFVTAVDARLTLARRHAC
jgi:hypothetical protein